MKWLFVMALVPATAWACPHPPPMRSKLSLVTAPDATLPADGAILVTRLEVQGNVNDVLTVEDGAGKPVALTVEDMGSGVERWVPVAGTRDLVLRDQKHAVVATLHQTKQAAAALAAPSVRSFRSTLVPAEGRNFPGVPGGTTKLELGKDAPAGARFLVIAVSGSGARAHSAIAPTANQRTFESTTYAHKGCAGGGPGPIAVGEHVSISWLDDLGRRSAATTTTTTKLR